MAENRLSKDDYYFAVVDAVRQRATCDRGRSGAILVKDGRIIATGYVGSPAGLPHCDEVGHEFIEVLSDTGHGSSRHCIKTTHAEANAIVQCARHGPSCDGATLYCTMTPCRECAKLIINAGIVSVNALHDYQKSARSKELFREAGVSLKIWNERSLEY